MSAEADPVAACLAKVRERADWVRKTERSRLPDAPYTLSVARRNSARDVRPLLAAVEKVLELATKAEHGATRWEDSLPVPEWVPRVREAIARELLGEGGDGHPVPVRREDGRLDPAP